MILFVGNETRGFFLKETAAMRDMEIQYIDSSPSIGLQLTEILKHQMEYLVVDIEQYVDSSEDIAAEIERIKRAKNCDVIVYAPGYDRETRMIQALIKTGIRYYILSATQAGAKEELERCLNGYYIDPESENMECEEEPEKGVLGKKIGVTGVCRRMGTTTTAVQLVKYLQVKGYKACYVEMNETGFVQAHGEYFISEHDSYLGKVVYESVDMFYKQEHLQEILKLGYDYLVFDYGAYSERGFNKISFLEKDVRIFVAGSKASEMEYTEQVLKNEYYTDVSYFFNFISEKEKPDLLEFMEDKAESTYFGIYTPDQFEYVHNEELERLLPVEDKSTDTKKKGGLFRWHRGKKGKHGKKAEEI